MAACIRCNAETQLYKGDEPICIACSFWDEPQGDVLKTKENHILKILIGDFVNAKKCKNEASGVFDDVMSRPSKLPHPDGTQRIMNASSQLSVAQKTLTRAHYRLSDFLGRGIVPDDLKQKE